MSSDFQTTWQVEREMSTEFMSAWVKSPEYGGWCDIHDTAEKMRRDDILAYMGV